MNDSDGNFWNLGELQPIDLEDYDAYEEMTVKESVDYILAGDPLNPDKQESWVIIILKGIYQEWVVRIPEMNKCESNQLEFTYEVLYHPELPDGFTLDEGHIANFMGAVVTDLCDTAAGHVEQPITVKLGEQIDI